MVYHRLTIKLIVVFAAAVLIPGIVLGIIASRTLRYEETYLERRLEDTLRVEVDQTVDLIRKEVVTLADQLAEGLPPLGREGHAAVFRIWKENSLLVEIPFLVSRDNQILWPRSGGGAASAEDVFLADNQGFLTDEADILSFQNVALLPGRAATSATVTGVSRLGSWREESSLEASAPAQLKENVALARFRRSPEVQRQLYQQAETEQKKVLARSVLPRQQAETETAPERSILVAEPLNFSRITAGADQGFIPRLTGSKLEIFFWKKIPPAGEIAGCLVNLKAFTERILAVLPVPYSATRLLTVLDQDGLPLLDPLDESSGREWKRPFFSREIGAVLPRWEVAAYLSDPASLVSRARFQSLITGVLIALLLIAILGGSFLIFRSFNQEILLAQQKTSFAANVSHELKTPLTSIRLFAEILEQGRQPDRGKQQKYLKMIVSESKRLSRLINTVLDFSRIEQGKKTYRKQKIDLAEVAGRVVENLRIPLEEQGFTVRLNLPMVPVPVLGDPEALEQVLINLLANAEKYSGQRREIKVELAIEGDQATITVSDRGIGIPKAAAKKIFQKFYRVDERLTARVKGTGLGLTIAQAIVREHAGKLAYQPREGGGSRFCVRLPLCP